MINQIEDKDWKQIFEACVPAIKQSADILHSLMPYLIYYSLRFNQSDLDLGSHIANFINDVLVSDVSEHIDQILKALDFLNICLE